MPDSDNKSELLANLLKGMDLDAEDLIRAVVAASEIKKRKEEEVPEDAGNVITLDTSDTDLKEYIKKDEFSLRLNTVTDELISTDHELEVNSTFFVDAKILGL